LFLHRGAQALDLHARWPTLPRRPFRGSLVSRLVPVFRILQGADKIAQEIHTPEGSYWHGIVHRQEPDAGNSGYWFRQVGRHPIFPALRAEAAAIGIESGPEWDPFAFISLCERARREPGSDEARLAIETQRAEWQLLFDYCARASLPRA